MIDFHSHVLPGIDDGSQSIEESRRLLEESARRGVTHLAATPHFYAQQESFDRFLEKREHALERVISEKEKWDGVPRFFVGAEVYYFPGMGKAERLRELCYRGTDILLLEMPFAQWTEDVLRDVENILEKQKLRIVLAHIERYYEFQKKKNIWNEIFDLPVIPQMNTGAFLHKKKRLCLKLAKKYSTVLLGTDCHNMSSRCPNMDEGREVIRKKLGEKELEAIDSMGQALLLTPGEAVSY